MFISILYVKCSIVSVIESRISPEAEFKALP